MHIETHVAQEALSYAVVVIQSDLFPSSGCVHDNTLPVGEVVTACWRDAVAHKTEPAPANCN